MVHYQTCLTAQNTLGVTSVSPTSTSDLRDQLDAVLSDIGTDALKTGMIPSAHLAMVSLYYFLSYYYYFLFLFLFILPFLNLNSDIDDGNSVCCSSFVYLLMQFRCYPEITIFDISLT